MSRTEILIVAHDPALSRELRLRLSGLGYDQVVECSTAERGLQLAQEIHPTVAFVDIALGGGDGAIAAAQQIHKRFAVPVLFITPPGNEETLQRAVVADPFGYITTPVEEHQLRAVIQMAIYRDQAEARLRQSLEEKTAILNSAMDGFWIADLSGHLLDVNEAYCRMSGYSREELLRMTISDVTAEPHVPSIPAQIARIVSAGSARFERSHRRKDGSLLDVEVSVNFLPGSGGRLFNFIRDITERKRAEQAQRASEERFRNLLQNLRSVSVQGYSADGTTLYWNTGSELLYGYSAAEAVGRNLLDLTVPPERREDLRLAIRRMAETGEPLPAAEVSRQRQDGSLVPVFSSYTVLNSPGRPPELFCIDIDLAQRERAEQALRDSERKFSQAFEHSPVMMTLSPHEDGTFLEVNDAFLAVSGFTRDEVVGRDSSGIGWVDAGLRASLLGRLVAEGRLKEIEIPARTKAGAGLRVLYSAEQLEVGGQRLVLSTWHDVTEHRRVEALLRLQSSALEAAANAIVITDRKGVIQWANTAFTRFSGYAPHEFAGRTFRELINSGHHEPAFFQQLWATILAGNVWHGEITNRRKDDSIYVDETTITSVKTGGEITHFIAVKQDVTQRKTLEEQFRQAQKMEAVGQLAGGVAHDFNNILAAVLMYLGILEDETSTDGSLRGMLKELQKEVKRGAGLTRQLLTFSRQQAIEPQMLDVAHVLGGLMNMLSRLLGEHIAISVQAGAEPLPPIEADPGMVEQVIINLCVNARDAMEHGGKLTLRTGVTHLTADSVRAHPQGRPGPFVRVDVVDTGTGMDERTLQRIFEPFFTTKPVGKGTGLGLATVYGIVKQHQGWVEVQSEVGRGTTFSVFLPAAGSEAALPTETEAPQPQRGRGEVVLLVEDDVNVRSVMTRSLQLGGYRVLEAETGPSALTLWRRDRAEIALLVTDMVLPDGMDGRELAATLRQEKLDLPVVLCTGYSHVMALASAADRLRLLRKPFGAPELLRVVRDALDAK